MFFRFAPQRGHRKLASMCPLGAVKALRAAALHDGASARAWRVRLVARFSIVRRAAEKRDEFLPPHGTFPSCRNSGRSEAITFAARSRSIAMWWAADSMRFDPATDARCEKLTMDPIGFGQRERLGIVVVAAFAVSAASVAYAKVYS